MKAGPKILFNFIVMLSLLMGMTAPAVAQGQMLKAATAEESAVTTQVPNGITFNVSDPVTAKLSQALRDLPQVSGKEATQGEINPPRGEPETRGTDTTIQDPLAANGLNNGLTPDPIFTFEGLGDLNLYTPPDTTGDVGPNHYVQMVNVKIAIFDKSGSLLFGPVDINSLWDGYGGACETMNDGDPIVLYDDMADRWMISQFAIEGSPQYQCVAVSTSPDPLGSYYLYAFVTPDFPDYPKFGVWPDGYYFGTNTGFPNSYYAHALDRVSMLSGNPSVLISFGGFANFLMPADADGQLPPPVDAPEYFYTYFSEGYPDHPAGVDRLAMYEFDVDWVTPANSTFSLVTEIPIAPYNYTVCGFFGPYCIDEPSPGVGLDSLSWWPMVRLQYRNFGAYEAMVSNFTVDVDGSDTAGIRWFELRKAASDPWSLFQEGTYAPDASHRWMGSIAMDGSGNIALGYSVSDATVTKPSIRYAVHQTSDPLGTMQAEAVIINGDGVNTGPFGRWGDYSAMNVDPVDQCTFWYTNEYHDVNESSFMWNTYVGVFSIPTCSGGIGPTGTLNGNVSDSVTTDPIASASIAASLNITQTYGTSTDPLGDYEMALPTGIYTVTASTFGYLPETISGVEVFSGTVTTQDFTLDPAPTSLVYGYVTDATTGWPLYASIAIAGVPGSPFWTNPVNGYFEVMLPQGSEYDLTVDAFVPGYITEERTIGPLNGDQQEDFGLLADPATCTAPGYYYETSTLFAEDFESGYAGWTMTGLWNEETESDVCGSAVAPFPSPTHGAYYGVDSACTFETGAANSGDLTSVGTISLPAGYVYWLTASSYSVTECGGDCSFDNRMFQVSTDGSNFSTVGEVDFEGAWGSNTFVISEYAGDDVYLRFSFDTTDRVSNDYFGWLLDDVSLQQAECVPAPGGLVVGNVYDANTDEGLTGAEVSNEGGYNAETQPTPEDENVDDGFYTIFSLDGTQTHTATIDGGYQPDIEDVNVIANDTVEQDFFLEAGWLTYTPPSLNTTLPLGASEVQALILTNLGVAPVSFELLELDKGMVPVGMIESPEYGLVRPRRQQYKTAEDILPPRPIPDAEPFAAGDVVQSWPASAQGAPWGIAYDSNDSTVWVGEGWGSNEIFEYGTDGSPTGRSHPFSWNPLFGPADLAYNWNTGMLWSLDVGGDDCIHEIDPASGVTGITICPAFSISQRGLAYDPSTDTYFAGGWNDAMVYRFDSSGAILEAVNTGLSISGLAFNPETQHLFVMVNDSPNPVYVLDTANGYVVIGQFNISEGFGDFAGAGLEFDCEGYLWGVDQSTGTVYQFESGETTGSMCAMDVPWLSESPITGTIPGGNDQDIDVTFDAAAVSQPGIYHAQLKINNDTPYPVSNVPITLTVTPTDNLGKLLGTVSSLGYCDENPAPLEGAMVVIESASGVTWTLETNEDGFYSYWLDESGGPYSVAVTADDHESGFANSIEIVGGGETMQDFELRWLEPCVSVDPTSFDVEVGQGGSLSRLLELTNAGAMDTDFELREKNVGFTPPLLDAPESYSARAAIGPMSVRSPEGRAALGRSAIQAPNSWLNGALLPNGGQLRYAHAQCADEPDSFYIISGVDASFSLTNNVWRYDVDTDTWTPLAPFPIPQEGPSGVCFEGYIYVAGGGGTNQFYIYDIAADSWSAGPALPRNVWGSAMGALDGFVYMAGGDNDFFFGGTSNEVDIFDITGGTWSTGTPMPAASVTAGSFQTGEFLFVVGGWDDNSPGSNSSATQRYEMGADNWESGPSFNIAKADFSLAASDTYLYAIGGDANGGSPFDMSDSVYWLDHTAWPGGTWADTSDPIPTPLTANNAGFCTEGATGGEVWTVGGIDISSNASDGNYYRPSEGCFTELTDVWWLEEDPITGTLPSDSTAVVDVTFVTTPTTPLGTYTAFLRVRTDDPITNTIEIPVTVTVVAAVYDVDISADQAMSGRPAMTVTYEVTLTNNSNGPQDTFDIAVVSLHGWTVNAPADIGPVAAGESVTFDVEVEIPFNAKPGTEDAAVVTATSQGDVTVSDAVTLTTTVKGLYLPLVMKGYTVP